MIDQQDKFLATMYGLAIGDALGFPNEFLRIDQIREKHGLDGLQCFEPIGNSLPPGSYSDDTQMSLAIANGLINAKSDQLDDLMSGIVQEYINWLNDPENVRAPGQTCIDGVTQLKNGTHWRESGDSWSKGCGAAMRTAPIGLYFNDDAPSLIELAYASSACTHGNPTGIAAGIGTAYLVSLAFNGERPENMVDKLHQLGEQFDNDFAAKIKQVKKVLAYDDHLKAIKELGEGWIGEEAVAIALYCFLKNPNDYRKTVLMAANTNGDSDSIACIAGAISGAYNGLKAIPSEWVRNVEKSGMVGQVAQRLYDKFAKKTETPNKIYLFATDLTDELFGFKEPQHDYRIIGETSDQRHIIERALRNRNVKQLDIQDVLVIEREDGQLVIGQSNLESREPADYLPTKNIKARVEKPQESILEYLRAKGSNIIISPSQICEETTEVLESLVRKEGLDHNIVLIRTTGYNEQLASRFK